MAGSSLLLLLDDIATLLDDVAMMSKIAAKKTSGVIGDDIALNAEQVSGIRAEREIPVIWAVAKGSFLNKCILVPLALLISAIASWAITPLLMLGGAFLCFEGFEKIYHKLSHGDKEPSAHSNNEQVDEMDIDEYEKIRIKGAIRTDFILSAEIIVIALGTVKDVSLVNQSMVVSFIAFSITILVYGFVAGVVKLDDAGIYLVKSPGQSFWVRFKKRFGQLLLDAAPLLMKTLSVVGTAAMFLVGGGILLHGIPHSHEFVEHAEHFVQQLSYAGPTLKLLLPTLISALSGVIAGAMLYFVGSKIEQLRT